MKNKQIHPLLQMSDQITFEMLKIDLEPTAFLFLINLFESEKKKHDLKKIEKTTLEVIDHFEKTLHSGFNNSVKFESLKLSKQYLNMLTGLIGQENDVIIFNSHLLYNSFLVEKDDFYLKYGKNEQNIELFADLLDAFHRCGVPKE